MRSLSRLAPLTLTLALALKRTSPEVEALVMRNLSERVREMLLSDMEALGKVRVTEVMEAQQKIVECFRNLERTGEVPPAFKALVEEYYRSLSRTPKKP